MVEGTTKEAINTFIEVLLAEKGYSSNTARAYRRDIEAFFSFVANNADDEKVGSSHNPDHLAPLDSINPLTLRKYLGHLHKKKQEKFFFSFTCFVLIHILIQK